MRVSEWKIRERLREIDKDESIHYASATIDINAPLALIQLSLEKEVDTLRWVLGMPPWRNKDRSAPHTAEERKKSVFK